MKITSVRVHRLMSGPGFNNRALAAEALVEEDESPEQVRERLSAWVDGQLADGQALDCLRQGRNALDEECDSLRRERDRIRADIAAGYQIITNQQDLADLARERGIAPGALGEDIPF